MGTVIELGGLTIEHGVASAEGVTHYIDDIVGWDVLGSTGEVDQRAGEHGGWATPAYRPPRLLEVLGQMKSDSWATTSVAIEALLAAIPLEAPDDMVVTVPDETPRVIRVRQQGQPLVSRRGHMCSFSLSLIAPDPFKYSAGDPVTLSTGLPLVTGGLVLPITFPLTIGATYSAGTLVAVNDGTADTFPTFTLTGPVPTGATITHEESGAWLRYDQPIAAGHTLTIDTETRTALLDGSAPRTLVGTWFAYSPGDNTVRFTASTYDAAALLTSSHRSAWR